MRSSNSKGQPVVNGSDVPIQNGISSKEQIEESEEARHLAAKVVEDVVRLASKEANHRPHSRNIDIQSLPTIQVDTVLTPSPSLSPEELSPSEEEEPLNENHIEIHLQDEQSSNFDSEELKEDLKRYLEDILNKAMVVAQKKLQFVGVSSSEEEDDEANQPGPSSNQKTNEQKERLRKEEEEKLEEEIREAAEKVVEEVLTKATETVAEKMEKFPDMPTFQIDTVASAPPSPEAETIEPASFKKWVFKMKSEDVPASLVKFDDAPDDVKEAATEFIKDLIEKAVTKAMEQEKIVPTVPFSFGDVDLMKSSGPWYVRVREAFVRVLRTACFCTPRRDT